MSLYRAIDGAGAPSTRPRCATAPAKAAQSPEDVEMNPHGKALS